MGYPVRQLKPLALPLFLTSLLMGCGSGGETERKEEDSAYLEALHKYEAQFRPSDYEVSFMRTNAGTREASDAKTADRERTPIPEAQEIVAGYRVQLLSTKDIDAASARKAEVEAAFPEDWFYLIYDAPTYKLRVGNFLARADAERFAKQLADKGFPDAWSVPDKVVKNPPPRAVPQSTEIGLPPK